VIQEVDACDLGHKKWRQAVLFTGDLEDASRVLLDMSQALLYLRFKSVQHNDIKPRNILYSKSRGAILIDFGLTTNYGDPASKCGTPWYIAPEYLSTGQREAPADIWALGIVMIYLIRRISYPEIGYQVKTWLIKDINSTAYGQIEAERRMAAWLKAVKDVTSGLNKRIYLEGVILHMLHPIDNQRIKASELVTESQALY
jgi:serine/threonine protein kinase